MIKDSFIDLPFVFLGVEGGALVGLGGVDEGSPRKFWVRWFKIEDWNKRENINKIKYRLIKIDRIWF